MTDLTHYRRLILNFAYNHIHPGGGFEALIKLRPGFQHKLDQAARENLAELLDFAEAHVPHDTRNAAGFDDWLGFEPTQRERELFDKWISAITPMPRGWEEVDTSHG